MLQERILIQRLYAISRRRLVYPRAWIPWILLCAGGRARPGIGEVGEDGLGVIHTDVGLYWAGLSGGELR